MRLINSRTGLLYHRQEEGGFCGVRAFGWQLDFRPDRWLPLSYPGWRPWRIWYVGKNRMITLGRMS